MNVRRAVEIAIQIADAVADAHAAGFVHGGLSPDSIVITAKGHAKIPAFELAAQSGFDQDGRDGAAARLRLARGGARPDAGRPLRHLFGRRDPVRDAHHAAADAPRRVGAERVEPQGAEGARRGRAEGARAESGRPLSERRRRSPASCAASIAVLDALGVAGEEEELAQTRRRASAACCAWPASCCSWSAVLAWWFWS